VKFSRQHPGFPVSTAAHVGLLAATLIAFAQTPKFEEAQETVPIEVVSDQQLNQIIKGEKTAPAVKPAQRAEKVSEQVETHPTQPKAEAKRDIPTPPPSFKRLSEPSEDDTPQKQAKEAPTPPKRVAALPPPTPEPAPRPAPAPTPKPTPAPPVKPQVKAAPEPDKNEPDDAEIVKLKPPVKPKLDKAEQQETPTPPKAPEKPKFKETPRLKTNEVAKLLQQKQLDANAEKSEDSDEKDAAAQKPEKSDKPGKSAKPKSGDETAPKTKFSAASIANLLSHEAPQQRASTGREKTQVASLGAPTASAAKMSPSLQGKIDSYTVEHYRRCWATALSMNALTYVPRVEFRLTRTGGLEGSPRLLNPSPNPVEKARGEQALAAVRRCSPMPIPAEFSPYYDYWRVTELDMKEDM
jgi:colicin import membrane protein